MQRETIRAVLRLFLFLLSGSLLIGNAGCRSQSPAPKTASVAADKIDKVISHWDSPLHPSVPPSSAVARQNFQAIQNRAAPILYSHQPFHEVEIPLFFQGGFPFLHASWSGRQIACLVDTGTGTMMWPQWMHLDTQQLHLSRTQEWPSGMTARTEWMLTSRIDVGGLALINVPTEAIGVPKPADAQTFPYAVLGMQAFNAFVITIDYRGKRLLLRDAHYDVTRQPHTANAQLIPYKGDAYGRVVLPGTVVGHNATFSLDTGSSGLFLSSSFAQKYLSLVPNQADFRKGPFPALHNLSGTVNGLPFQGLKGSVFHRVTGSDVLLGSPFFLKYRVTIDRFRGMLLIEKNL